MISRLEQFAEVESTQQIVAQWLAMGTPEICVATADHQTGGRGRRGRAWVAPPGAGLLVSLGFRPRRLALAEAWQLSASCALAMRDAAEQVAGLPPETLWLKWPNDLVADGPGDGLRKCAGLLGQTSVIGMRIDTAVIGIGINVDWDATSFPSQPAELANSMTSLRELSGSRPIDRDALLAVFLEQLAPRYEALASGSFDHLEWAERQRTTGCAVTIDLGERRLEGVATGVDGASGGLIVDLGDGRSQTIETGDVVRCRIGPKATV